MFDLPEGDLHIGLFSNNLPGDFEDYALDGNAPFPLSQFSGLVGKVENTAVGMYFDGAFLICHDGKYCL